MFKTIWFALLIALVSAARTIDTPTMPLAGEGHIFQVPNSDTWVLGMDFRRYIITSNSSGFQNDTNYEFNYVLDGTNVSLSNLVVADWQLNGTNYQTGNGHWMYPFVFMRAQYREGADSPCMSMDVAIKHLDELDKMYQAMTGGWFRIDRGRSYISHECIPVTEEQYVSAASSKDAAIIYSICFDYLKTQAESTDVLTRALWSYDRDYKTNIIYQSHVNGTMGDFAGMGVVADSHTQSRVWAIVYMSIDEFTAYSLSVVGHEVGHTFSNDHSDITPLSVAETYGPFYSYPYQPPNGYGSHIDFMGSGSNYATKQAWSYPYQIKHVLNNLEAGASNWDRTLNIGNARKYRLFAADHAASKAFLGLRTSRFNDSDSIEGVPADQNSIYFRVPWGNDFVSVWPADVLNYTMGMEYRSIDTARVPSNLGVVISLLDDQSRNVENTLDARADNVSTAYSCPFPYLNVPWSAPGADKGTFRIRITKIHNSPAVEFQQLYTTNLTLEDCSYVEMEIDYAPNEILPVTYTDKMQPEVNSPVHPLLGFQDMIVNNTIYSRTSDQVTLLTPQPSAGYARIMEVTNGDTSFKEFVPEVTTAGFSYFTDTSLPKLVKFGATNDSWTNFKHVNNGSCLHGFECRSPITYNNASLITTNGDITHTYNGSVWIPDLYDLNTIFSSTLKDTSVPTAFLVDAFGNRDYCVIDSDVHLIYCPLKTKSSCTLVQFFLTDVITDELYYWSNAYTCNYESSNFILYDLNTDPVQVTVPNVNETSLLFGWLKPILLEKNEWAYTYDVNDYGYLHAAEHNTRQNYNLVDIIGEVPKNLVMSVVISGFSYDLDLSSFAGLANISLNLPREAPIQNTYGGLSNAITRFTFNQPLLVNYRIHSYDHIYWGGPIVGFTNNNNRGYSQFHINGILTKVYTDASLSNRFSFKPFTSNGYDIATADTVYITDIPAPRAIQNDNIFRSDANLEPCDSGFYNNKNGCEKCTRGYMCPLGKLIPCAAGTYQNETGQVYCVGDSIFSEKRFGAYVRSSRCPGNYLKNSTGCQSCPENYSCDGSDVIPCLDSIDKYYSFEFDSCIDVPSGFKRMAGSNYKLEASVSCSRNEYFNGSSCVIVPPGYFFSRSLTKCPIGYSCNNNTLSKCAVNEYAPLGSSSCSTCENGFQSSFDKGSCIECPAGSKCVSGFNTPCPPGSYSSSGSSECTLCPIGTSAMVSGSPSCLPCISGYAPIEGLKNCLIPPPGKMASENRSSLVNCTAGSACNNGISFTCIGRDKYSLSGASSCSTCPEHMHIIGYKLGDAPWDPYMNYGCEECPVDHSCNYHEITPCSPDSFSFVSGICSRIPDGYHKVNSTIVKCPVGSRCSGGSIQACRGWSYTNVEGASHCSACPATSYVITVNGTNVDCTPCRAGYWCTQRQEFACNAGTFNPDTGKTWPQDCKACPAGTFTTLSGSTTCYELPMYYTVYDGYYLFSFLGHEFNQVTCASNQVTPNGFAQCYNCTEGYKPNSDNSQCIPTADKLELPHKDGYLTISGSYVQCPAGVACVNNTVTVCEAGYSSNAGSVSCSACDAGFFTPGIAFPSCFKCPEGQTSSKGSSTCYSIALDDVQSQNGISTCPKGSWCRYGVATECPVNTYQPLTGQITHASCLDCPKNTTSNADSAVCYSS